MHLMCSILVCDGLEAYERNENFRTTVAGGRRAMRSGPSNFFSSKLGDRFIPGTVVLGRTIDRTAIHHQ